MHLVGWALLPAPRACERCLGHSRAGNTSQGQQDLKKVSSYPSWEIPSFSFPLSSLRAVKCFTDLSHGKVLGQVEGHLQMSISRASKSNR